jgi:hypothetical protein
VRRTYEINENMLGANVMLYIGTPEQCARWVTRRTKGAVIAKPSDVGKGYASSFTVVDEYENPVSYCIRLDSVTPSINHVVHECNHVAFKILKVCDIPADADNQEMFAYLSSWLVERVLGELGLVVRSCG